MLGPLGCECSRRIRISTDDEYSRSAVGIEGDAR